MGVLPENQTMTTTYDPNNIFARILRGEIPAKKIYEDDFALAFPDINPQAPTHVLVIPKGAYVSFADFAQLAPPEAVAGYIRAIGVVAELVGVKDSGYRLLFNAGANAHQEVPHLHCHIFGGKRLGPMLVRE